MHRIFLVTSRPRQMAGVISALQAADFDVSVSEGESKPLSIMPDMIIFDVLSGASEELLKWSQIKAIPLMGPVPILFMCASQDIARQWPGCSDGEHCIAGPQSAQDLCSWVQKKRVSFGLALAEHPTAEPNTPATRPLVQAAKAYLSRHYAQANALESLSQAFNMDPTLLAASFHDTLGVTMHEFLLDERMRQAQRLLLQSSGAISEIAQAVGYGTTARFSSEFREAIGITPSAYRRSPPAASVTTQGALRWTSP